ncbi:nucleotidyltransferase domain-containing protein [Candidatus Woesearchaeota archaeon]|nr:nucleotidyltransferase domain-containing protein [Candidatus Woesearchaeota archaeon]
MDKKKSIINQLREFKLKTSHELPIKNMYLFGSRARGKAHRWSDVDLIIVSKKFKKLTFRKRVTKMYDYWYLDYPVDFLCYTPEEFERKKKEYGIVKQAVKEGIEL